MSPRHILVAVLIVALWGFNFVFIKLALHDFPPMTLCALRFLLTALPLVFFLKRPGVGWPKLIGYGFANFALQFGFLFTAMRMGMSPGLSSMIVQVQVFFTMALSVFIFSERPGLLKILGAVIAFSGVAFVGLHSSQDVNLLGLLILLLGACSWAVGNILVKSMGPVNPLALVVWGGLMASPFLIVAALFTDGPALIESSLDHVGAVGWWSLAYIVYASTHMAYSLWSWLLREYNASVVAPFSLLVPIFGFLSSAVILGEAIPEWKLEAAVLVVGGLAVNLLGQGRARGAG